MPSEGPIDWKPTTLGEIVAIKHGFAFKGEHFREAARPYVAVTPGNFAVGGGWQDRKLKYYEGPVPEDYVLSGGDLLVTMTDLSKTGDTLGYAAVVPRDLPYGLLHNQRIGHVTVRDRQVASKSFLHWLMRSAGYRHEVLASATGSTVRHTSPKRISAYQLMLPPLDEQRRIAAVLGALDDKIELNRKMNQTFEAMAQAIFKSWFIDFDGVPDADMVDSELGRIPKGWSVKPLDGIAHYLNGAACQKYPAEDGERGLPVIKIRELNQGVTDRTDRATSGIPRKWWVQDGDVLFSWSGSLVVALWTGGEGALNQHLFKVTSQDYPRWFYFLWTKHHLSQFQRIAADKATTMGHIKRHHLTDAMCAVPPQAIVAQQSNVLAPLIARLVANDLETRTLAGLRDTLLPKLISGEIRVPEAEQEVEAAI